ncbi:MAG: response regulator [Candidatus Methylomirabilales bacterium]
MVPLDAPQKKVLIADDEPSIRLLYQRELGKEGYQVVLAASGQEVIRLAREERPDAVVLDVRMPGVDGIQALQRILEEDNTLPVIINTAYSFYRENFMSWAAEAYVIKSSDLSELKEALRTALARKGER